MIGEAMMVKGNGSSDCDGGGDGDGHGIFFHSGKHLIVSEGGKASERGRERRGDPCKGEGGREWTESGDSEGGGDGEAVAGAGILELVTEGELGEVREGEEAGNKVLSEEAKGGTGGAGVEGVSGWGKESEGARPGREDRQIHGGHGHGELLKAELGEDRGQEEGLVRFVGRRS